MFIIRMTPDPEPLQSLGALACQIPVIQPDAHRVNILANFFELKQGMPRIRLEKGEVLICKQPNLRWQLPVKRPKPRAG